MTHRIIFGSPVEPDPPEEYVPTRFLGDAAARLTQQWQRDQILVFCQAQAHQEMHRHARKDQQHECTGVLIGQVFRDPDQHLPFVIISRALPIDTMSHSGTHVTVDVEGFRRTRTLIEQKYSGVVLVGWYHTHPNLGIFLSSTDMQVTRGLFNASWHIAIVIDPVRQEEGAFVRQGEFQLGQLVLVRQPTPITFFMEHYRQVCEQLDSELHEPAQATLRRLQDYYQEALKSGYEHDLRLWVERGGYRDVATLLEHSHGGLTLPNTMSCALPVPATAVSHSSSTPGEKVARDEIAPSIDGNQQMRDLLRVQDELTRQVQRLADEVRDRAVRRVHWLDLLNLAVLLLVLVALIANIYLR